MGEQRSPRYDFSDLFISFTEPLTSSRRDFLFKQIVCREISGQMWVTTMDSDGKESQSSFAKSITFEFVGGFDDKNGRWVGGAVLLLVLLSSSSH